jgi:hypothetical protein
MRQADFGEVLLLTDKDPLSKVDPRIVWRKIPPISSRGNYSRFMLRELGAHVRTSHALCIQWDGFVLNGREWDPQFLDYDYIGAVWPHFSDGRNVGNGGFSLRSQRLLAASKELPFDGSEAEDIVISRQCRTTLERQGVRFAPESVARRFAYERTPPDGREFGFHGAFNLVRHLKADESSRLFRELEPELLAHNERAEILRWALVRGQFKLALAMLTRLI